MGNVSGTDAEVYAEPSFTVSLSGGTITECAAISFDSSEVVDGC